MICFRALHFVVGYKKKTVNVYLLLQFHSLLILFAMLFSLFTEKKKKFLAQSGNEEDEHV